MPRFSRMRGGVLAAAVLATLLVTPAASASPRPGPPTTPDGTLAASAVGTMSAGQQLGPGEYLESTNGDYALVVETNGLLTVYGPVGPIWIRDDTLGAAALVLQGDGNLVAYDGSSQPLWASGTAAPGAVLVMQNDGNLVLYRSGVAVWASKSAPLFGRVDDRLLVGQRLTAGTQLVSDNGSYAAVMQGDGNLVIYGPSGVVWATGTGASGSYVTMQTDGNLVLYGPTEAHWFARNGVWPGALAVLDDDGVLRIYLSDGQLLWESASSPGIKLTHTTLGRDERLAPGQALWSADYRFRAVMQTDGNFVVYGPNGPNWASRTGAPYSSLTARSGHDYVIAQSPFARPVWHTGSTYTGGAFVTGLVLQNDGNLVIYRTDGSVAWASLSKPSWPTVPMPPVPYDGWW